MGLHFKASFDEKDQWRYECMVAGNTVVDPEGSNPELCMSNVTYTDPRDERWGSFDKIQCVRDGGIVGRYGNDFLCVHGKIESREP